MKPNVCTQCANGGKRYNVKNDGWPWGTVAFLYCPCPVGQAVAQIESTIINAEDVPGAVRKAIDLGTQFRGVGIPRYPGRPEVNAQLDALDAEIAEKGLFV
jgi:hypothetical protein